MIAANIMPVQRQTASISVDSFVLAVFYNNKTLATNSHHIKLGKEYLSASIARWNESVCRQDPWFEDDFPSICFEIDKLGGKSGANTSASKNYNFISFDAAGRKKLSIIGGPHGNYNAVDQQCSKLMVIMYYLATI